MSIWLVMLLGGLVTFAIRFSFIYLFGKLHIPGTVRRALHYIPPAVLSALVFPELFMHERVLSLSLDNTRLLAGLMAVAVAWYSKNTLLTIVVGMLALVLLEWLM